MKKVDLNIMSNYVILFCQNMGVTITPLKLQKILYYIQAWHIAKFEKESLFDTLPEAWVNGPVYRQIYNQYKGSFFKNANIQATLDEDGLAQALMAKQSEMDLDEKQLTLVNAVLDAYSKLSDERLVLMTHSEDPWTEIRKNLLPIERSDKKLSVDTIYNYFNRRK